MKYSLLNYICCPTCSGDLTFIIPPPGEVTQDDASEIENGLLACNARACSRWFPIRNLIPELLPDHLRNWEKDLEFLKTWEQTLPASIFKELWEQSQSFANRPVSVQDHGSNYKKSEISIKSRVTEADFFGPGFSSPFNPGNPEYTMHLIRRLGNVLPLLELKRGDVVLDMGAGYAWTTEWLMKMGMVAIGVDICRTYLDIGVRRMGKTLPLPYLVIGDIENLPIKNNRLDAVLCYDAFHHIPDRKKAMGRFHRALKDRGNIVLAEPGGMHEFARVSTEVMDKYGILEKGMELDDINGYCEGLNVLPPEQHFVLKIQGHEVGQTLSREFVYAHPYVDCNIFVVKKQADTQGLILQAPSFKKKIKTKIKRLLKRVFFKLVG
ncbi:MAG: methyltransferase domain-containing protein [Candidatus Aminicenantes bacterium]|nr:methyltransferase domain-containing protein [Candidatus Aminicenantes bacterium]